MIWADGKLRLKAILNIIEEIVSKGMCVHAYLDMLLIKMIIYVYRR